MVQVLTFPRPTVPPPKTATWRLAANTLTHLSPLDQTVQTLELVGARWVCDATWSGLNAPEWRAFESFLAQLRGAAGRFYFWPPHAWKPRTPIAASPTVVGANQNGTTLLTIGWPPSMTVLNQGDYFAVDNYLGGRELKIIRQPMFTNSGGAVYLTFDPPLRRSPIDGAPIMLDRPTAIMRLANDEQGAFDHEEGGYASVTLQLIEVFQAMRELSAAVRALIADDVIRPAICVALYFDSGAVTANTSPIDIQVGGVTYLGVGLLGKISAVEESIETQAHQLTFELSGIPPELISLALQEKYQGRFCSMFVVYLDADHRMPDGAYKSLFGGRINAMKIELGVTATIRVSAESRFADWDRMRGGRYTDEEQQRRFPGDLGLEFTPRMVEKELPWGSGMGGGVQQTPPVVQGGGGGKK